MMLVMGQRARGGEHIRRHCRHGPAFLPGRLGAGSGSVVVAVLVVGGWIG
jgi:hypothetical protein